MRVFNEGVGRTQISLLVDLPVAMQYSLSAQASLLMKDGSAVTVGCLGCINPRCMNFTDTEIGTEILSGFPCDQAKNVCPVDAIKWNYDSDAPIVNNEQCIRCGICVKRCPVGALSIDTTVTVHTEKTPLQVCVKADTETLSKQNAQIEEIMSIPKSGYYFQESKESIKEIQKKLSELKSNFHNLVVRNLLIELGCECAMRRIGDVYTRMDAIYKAKSESIGAIEVEFGHDTLDASRGILDDIAVLNTRYKLSKYDNKAVVVCLQLPNARQGYWQVVRDISIVEKIEINTVSIAALLILLWNNGCFDPIKHPYYLDYENMNLRAVLERHIGRKVNLPAKYLGLLEPLK